MRRLHRIVSIAALCALPVWACGDKTHAGYGTETKGTAHVDKTYGYDQRDEFRKDTTATLAKIETRLDELRAKVKSGATDVKEGTEDVVADLESGLADVRRQLADVGTATRDGWDDFKRKITSSLKDLERRLDEA